MYIFLNLPQHIKNTYLSDYIKFTCLLIRYLFLIFLSDVLQPNYDNVEHKMNVFDDRVRKPLILSCNITTPGNYKLNW